MKCLHQKMVTVLFYSKREAYCSYHSTSIAEIFMLEKVPAVMMLGEFKNNLAEVKEMKQQETGNMISVMGTLWHCREWQKETQKGIGLFLTISQETCRVAASDYVKAREAERQEVHCMTIKLGWNLEMDHSSEPLMIYSRHHPPNNQWWQKQVWKVGTLMHILSLVLGWYYWRYNEVLKIFCNVTKKQMDEINSGKERQSGHFITFMHPSKQSS